MKRAEGLMGTHTFYMKVTKMLEDLKAAMRRVQCNPRNKGKNREHVSGFILPGGLQSLGLLRVGHD